ncbi:protein-ER retention protein [Cryptotrichosporon argae]
MDIDSPPTDTYSSVPHTHINLPTFSSSFPLPFRVLFLVGLAQLLWAANLHVLHLLGIDVAWVLDIRSDDPDPPLELDTLDPRNPHGALGEPDTPVRAAASPPLRVASGRVYQPVYQLFALYAAWVGGGWLVFRLVTQSDHETMERWRWFVGVIALGAIAGVVTPWQGVGARERRLLLRAVRRIFVPSLSSPIFFCDVILADILTSFAKVLGDLWISACQIVSGGITQGRVAQSGWSQWVTLAMVSLPYVLRFRQCVLESYQSGWTSTRPLANALKYFSAFPVIFLSAAQKGVVYEVAAAKGMSLEEFGASGGRWFGEHRVFRLWLLAVVVNSMYSFYWDVQKDWGLSLCDVDTWVPAAQAGSALLGTPGGGRPGARRERELGLWARLRHIFGWQQSAINHQRSPCPSPAPFDDDDAPHASSSPRLAAPARAPFGLRPTILLPDPLVYHLFALVDLVLRFTWSLKLSSHLHTISEIESGVFMMEALELLRRWMWVFVRVEWEAVKMGEMARFRAGPGRERTAVVWDQANEDEPQA